MGSLAFTKSNEGLSNRTGADYRDVIRQSYEDRVAYDSPALKTQEEVDEVRSDLRSSAAAVKLGVDTRVFLAKNGKEETGPWIVKFQARDKRIVDRKGKNQATAPVSNPETTADADDDGDWDDED